MYIILTNNPQLITQIRMIMVGDADPEPASKYHMKPVLMVQALVALCQPVSDLWGRWWLWVSHGHFSGYFRWYPVTITVFLDVWTNIRHPICLINLYWYWMLRQTYTPTWYEDNQSISGVSLFNQCPHSLWVRLLVSWSQCRTVEMAPYDIPVIFDISPSENPRTLTAQQVQ